MFKLATLTEIRMSMRKYVMRYPIYNKISQMLITLALGISILSLQNPISRHYNYLAILLSCVVLVFALDTSTDIQYSYLIQFNHNVHLLIDDRYIEEESMQDVYATYRQLDIIITMRRFSNLANLCIFIVSSVIFAIGRGVISL